MAPAVSVLVLVFSTVPVIVAGMLNLAFIRSPFLESLRHPIDGNKVWRDGKPILGQNKTWKGVIGSVALTAACLSIFGIVIGDSLPDVTVYSLHEDHRALFLALEGALLGLAYVVAELPNSFFKRRLGIAAGGQDIGPRGVLFRTVDQVDSVIGCGLVLVFLGQISALDLLVLVSLGGLLHLPVSQALKQAGLR